MVTASATIGTSRLTGDVTISWIGDDDGGVELEVVVIDRPDAFLVVPVMPTHYRQRR
jgi:hypothetical protein